MTTISTITTPEGAARLLRELDIAGSYSFAAAAVAIEQAAAAGPGAALPIYRLGAEIEARVSAAIAAEVAEDPGVGSFPYPMLPEIRGGMLRLGWGRTVVSVRPAGAGEFFGERYLVVVDLTAVHDEAVDRGGDLAAAAAAVEAHPRHRTMIAAGAR